jgi:hypothetical protein
MAPFLMAFKPPPPNGHHPPPWKAASGGFSFDVQADLFIPSVLQKKYDSAVSLARTIVFLLRLGVNPAITLPVFSNCPFSKLPETEDKEARLMPFEVQPRYFPLGVEGGLCSSEAIAWVSERWELTHQLSLEHSEFSLAVDAIDNGQFVQNSGLALVSLWAALEALFSPSKSELKFRVSALIAAFLEPPGSGRLELQKEVSRLYDKRSAAAHGQPKHDGKDLVATFNLLRRVLIAMIDNGRVPSKKYLEERLFGASVGEST